jgi:hypothetical protein
MSRKIAIAAKSIKGISGSKSDLARMRHGFQLEIRAGDETGPQGNP